MIVDLLAAFIITFGGTFGALTGFMTFAWIYDLATRRSRA